MPTAGAPTGAAVTAAVPLRNPVRHYAWGSRTVLPAMVGEKTPADQPWAEIWIGAHPADPSRLPDGRSLAEVEPGLPFLVKLLAAAEPLSVQAHPDTAQAAAGYASEQGRGVALDAPERSYKDRNHKPELFVALTRTEALCGFRAPGQITALADRLACPTLLDLVAPARSGRSAPAALRSILTGLLTLPSAEQRRLVDEVVPACAAQSLAGLEHRGPAPGTGSVLRWVAGLADRYPADAAVLAPLLLNLVVLEPGDGLFVGAGVLHACLHGAGVEVQGSSDNVLRGGLTSKHVDVPGLLSVVRYGVQPAVIIRPVPEGRGLASYRAPTEDFGVWRVQPVGGPVMLPGDGPRLAVCVHGSLAVGGIRLDAGGAAYLPATAGTVLVEGVGTCVVAAGGPNWQPGAGGRDPAGEPPSGGGELGR